MRKTQDFMDFTLLSDEKQLEEMDRDFQEWFKNELFSETSEENYLPRGAVKMKFLLAKDFIIKEALKGAPRIYVWKYLKERGKIDGVYDTFRRHLKRYDVDRYFLNAHHHGKDIRIITTAPQKADDKTEDGQVEMKAKTPSPLSHLKDKKPLRFSEIHKKHADDVTNSKEETQESPKNNKPIFRAFR